MRRALANRDVAVMAALAGTQNFCMIYRRDRQPACRHMAGITLFGSTNVGCGFTSGNTAIMTALASTTRHVVINRGNR